MGVIRHAPTRTFRIFSNSTEKKRTRLGWHCETPRQRQKVDSRRAKDRTHMSRTPARGTPIITESRALITLRLHPEFGEGSTD